MSAPTTDLAGQTPGLSVVIASSNGAALLRQCLAALAVQCDAQRSEIIVVRASDRLTGMDREAIAEVASYARWIEAPAGATVPHLKGLGITAARGALIAVIEDDCLVDDNWCRAALDASGQGAAVGGAVEPSAYRRPLDWAVYFCEYGRFMLPLPDTSGGALPGNNVIYSRAAIAGLTEAARTDFRDVFVHAAWRREAVGIRRNGALVVRNINTWSTAHATSGPFHHGRAYAAERLESRNPAVRAGFALLTPGLPLLKVARIVKEAFKRKRHRADLFRALPWILVFVVSWSAGELAGSLLGPGDSPSRWR